MVVFTCNHCGESLQKPRVEKHYNLQCRKPKSLTCVDCFKDFKNEEYAVHTKCITEEERYAAKGSIPGGIVKKGDLKQESWTDMIRAIVANEKNLKPSLKNLFHTISNYTNVPRKKDKFMNFLKNSLGNRVNFSDVESAWDLIEKYKNGKSKQNSEPSVSENQEIIENGTKHKPNESNDEVPVKKRKKVDGSNGEAMKNETNGNCNDERAKKKNQKSKKNVSEEKISESVSENVTTEVNVKKNGDIFSFKKTILNILTKKGNISLKRLQKKVLNAYVEQTGNEYTEKTIKKYNKKLKKLPNIIINNEVATLQTCES